MSFFLCVYAAVLKVHSKGPAADVLVTKAGPGTIAEAAIRGLPCLLPPGALVWCGFPFSTSVPLCSVYMLPCLFFLHSVLLFNLVCYILFEVPPVFAKPTRRVIGRISVGHLPKFVVRFMASIFPSSPYYFNCIFIYFFIHSFLFIYSFIYSFYLFIYLFYYTFFMFFISFFSQKNRCKCYDR